MQNGKNSVPYGTYLEGGGEMGLLIRSFDWSGTAIGTPDTWPHDLLNTISLIFNSKYPMFIWWGPELIQFYNDAYRPLMGEEGKHPKALGEKGEKCWPEIWPVIKPLIDMVFKGEAVWREDQLIPILRNNRLDDVYWTFGYNGIRDKTGKIAGVLVICTETTEKVKTSQKIQNLITNLQIARKELEILIDVAELATWSYDPLTNRIKGNDRFRSLFGLSRDPNTDFDLEAIKQVIVDEDKGRINVLIKNAFRSTKDDVYKIIATIVNPKNGIKRIIKTKGKALHDAQGNLKCFIGTMQDVTDEYRVFAKRDDGLLTANLNLKGPKQTALEKLENFTVLHQSERVANMGSWQYDLSTDKLTFSDGMYRLFNLPLGSEISPELYLKYAAPQSRNTAAYIVACIEKTIPFEETLEILVDNILKTVKVQATVLLDEENHRLKIIGADIDMTEQRKLQQQKDDLERQQKSMKAIEKRKIFWATLNAQEEERKRIAESLHNGLGQLLYSVKLSLDHLTVNTDVTKAEWLESKQRTDHLLSQSIQESRRISHELSPALLNDFGLREAIKSICTEIRSKVLITCTFIGLEQRLDKNIETAIYRTAQELLVNIVKHAQASTATVKIKKTDKAVSIIVEDNGVGFNNAGKSNGIGLVTIRNKVKLLNGKFKLTSESGKGSIIYISIPYQLDKSRPGTK